MEINKDVYVLVKNSSEEENLRKAINEYKVLYGKFKKDILNKTVTKIIDDKDEDKVGFYLIKDYIMHRYNTNLNLMNLTDINLFKYIHESLEIGYFEEIEEDIKQNYMIKNHLINSYIANADNNVSLDKEHYDSVLSVLNNYNSYLEQKDIKPTYSKIK